MACWQSVRFDKEVLGSIPTWSPELCFSQDTLSGFSTVLYPGLFYADMTEKFMTGALNFNTNKPKECINKAIELH